MKSENRNIGERIWLKAFNDFNDFNAPSVNLNDEIYAKKQAWARDFLK